MSKKWREDYYATGKNTRLYQKLQKGYFLEYNESIKMYRINHDRGVPLILMGYSPHRKALINKLNRVVK